MSYENQAALSNTISGSQGADSLSYSSESGLASNPNASGSLGTYEQRAKSSGLGGERYEKGLEPEPQRRAHESLAEPGADGTSRNTYSSSNNNTTGTGTSTSNTHAGTANQHTEPSRVENPNVLKSGSAEDNLGEKTDNTDSHGDGEINEAQGDSKRGKLMEKAGHILHSQKLAEKGEQKREQKAALR